MPFWEKMRQKSWVRCMLVGMNASSIGLVFTACVKLYFKYVRVPGEAVVMLLAMLLVKGYGVKAPFAIIGCAALGWALFALDWGALARGRRRAGERPQRGTHTRLTRTQSVAKLNAASSHAPAHWHAARRRRPILPRGYVRLLLDT